MLTTAKAWELKRGDHIVVKGENYMLTDDPIPGPPGWTRLTTRDWDNLVTIHLIEGHDPVNVVRARDYTQQIRQAGWKGASRGNLRRR
jgi:hypothetical protein